MEFIRRFGVWVASAAIALAAVGVFVAVVPALAKQRKEKASAVEARRVALQTWTKKDVPNEAKIAEALKWGRQVTLQLDECGNYLGRQDRRAETRSFFDDEHAEQPVEIPASNPGVWREAYAKNNDELKQQLTAAGFGSAFPLQRMDSVWGTGAPTKAQMTEAMQLFWFQKDLADFLTEQVEKDLADYMARKAVGRDEPFPAEPSDLVIVRSPGRLDDLLRSMPRKQLAAILKAIVVNTQERDLSMIFNTYLPDGFPWERKGEEEKPSVLGLTIDTAQKKFMTDMLPPDKDDLANRQRFIAYIMELRTVRFREDVIGLLESDRHFEDLAKGLKKGTDEEYARVLADFDKEDLWSATRLAQAIAAIVSITNKKDYLLVRGNHSQNIAGVDNVTIHFNTGATGSAPGDTEIYKARAFSMRAKVEFKRLPIFLRRLLSNSWRYRVRILLVAPGAAGGIAPEGERAPMPGVAPMPMHMPTGGPSRGRPGPAPAPAPTPEAEPEVVEAGHYVTIQLDGEGFQFTPLLPKTSENPAGAAPPPGRSR